MPPATPPPAAAPPPWPWQLATIQLDFQMPERFDLTYVDSDGSEKRPVMIHRAPFGSMERFVGILIEHYAGALPLWLSPVQAVLLNITDRQTEYLENCHKHLRDKGFRVETDLRNEKVGYKIREHILQRVPYMLVIGDREMEEEQVTPRYRDGKNLPATSVGEFIRLIEDQVKQYK